jgi:hypothetical protein
MNIKIAILIYGSFLWQNKDELRFRKMKFLSKMAPSTAKQDRLFQFK